MVRRKDDLPRGVLKTETVDPTRYRHARYHPSADLGPFVEHYWAVAWDLEGLAPERAETLPHPSVHMIFERSLESRHSRVAGVSRGKFSRTLAGTGSVIAAKFRPGGFHPFLGADIATLTDRVVALVDLFPDSGAAADSILDAADDAPRIALLEEFLRSCRPASDPQAARAAEIVYAVAGDRTVLKVEDLVERYELNVRGLQRLFAKYVGVSPKWVIQRYRLHEAAEQLAANASIRQRDLAFSLGYSDQAHFDRDFKSVVGISPAAYARKAHR